MTKYRSPPNTGPHKLLLPLSLGLSSSVLLHALNAQVEFQRQSFKGPGYELYVLVIEPSSISPLNSQNEHILGRVKERYPTHSYTQVPLHSIFDHDPNIQQTLSQFAGGDYVDDSSLSNKERLDAFRAAIPTATSKADVDYVLLNRLVAAFAKQFGCVGVLWGDSDSRIAAKTLAHVAKGRGSSVTWQVSDGMSPWGLDYNFPLRDLFSTEIQQYASIFPELGNIIIPDQPPSENVLTKNLSIDELMSRYVFTQGEKYPGVMANVTRTAGKLQQSSTSPDEPSCTFCGAVMRSPGGTPSHSESSQSPIFCYGCIRSRPDMAS